MTKPKLPKIKKCPEGHEAVVMFSSDEGHLVACIQCCARTGTIQTTPRAAIQSWNRGLK